MTKSVVIFFYLCLISFFAPAQKTETASVDSSNLGKISLKLTPFTLLRNMWFTAHADYAFHPNFTFSLGLSPNFLAKGNTYQRDSIWDFSGGDSTYFDYVKSKGYPGFSIDPEIRWYPKGAWNGWFVGMYSSQRYSSTKFLEQQFLPQESSPGVKQYVPVNTGNYQILKNRVSIYGFQMGYVQRWGKRKDWMVDIFAGIGIKSTLYHFQNFGSRYPDQDQNKPGIAGRLNASIGYILK